MSGIETLPTIELLTRGCPHAERAAVAAAQRDGSLARLSDEWPIVQVLRQYEVRGLLRDPRLRILGIELLQAMGITDGPIIDVADADLLSTDGEQHGRLRRLLAAAFTPRSVEQLRPFARSTFAGLLDAVYERGECDAAVDLCDPYPTPVICQLIGFPPERWHDIGEWSNDIMKAFRLDAVVHRTSIEQAMVDLDRLVAEVVAQRRRDPHDDLISRLVELEQSTDRLTEFELRWLVGQMLVAGTDTTRGQLSLIIELLTRHPDVWAELRADPSLIPNAVEEALRFVPTATAAGRVTTTEMEIAGTMIPTDTMVFLNTLGANIDDEELPDAHRFDIHRELPKGWHLHTFGGGPHYCLGASLARLELVEALSELVARCPVLGLAGEPVMPVDGPPLLRYRSLPIRWR